MQSTRDEIALVAVCAVRSDSNRRRRPHTPGRSVALLETMQKARGKEIPSKYLHALETDRREP